MRWLLLLLCCTHLAAVEIHGDDADTLRFTRLALLKQEIRDHLGVEVGKYIDLDHAWLGRGDFQGNGKAEAMVLLQRGTKRAALLFDTADSELLARELTKHDGFVAPDVPRHLGRAYAATIGTRTQDLGWGTRTLHELKLLGLHNGAFVEAVALTETTSVTCAANRYRRSESAAWRDDGDALVLQVTVTETLDGTALAEPAVGARRFTRGENGLLRAPDRTEQPPDTTARLAIARKLDREGLTRVALAIAREAESAAAAHGIKESDARRLDARALIARLEAPRPEVTVSRQ